jgi:hypothetical protein
MPRSLKIDPAEPLRDARYERFAQLRVIGLTVEAAANEAPFRTRDGRLLLPGNAARIDRRADVRARKVYLAADDDAVLRETRAFVRNRLMKAASLDIVKQFGIVKAVEHDGRTIGELVGIDWAAVMASESSIAVSRFRFDRETGRLIDFDRDDALAAVAQLRDMHGFKAPSKIAPTNPEGDGPAVLEVQWKEPETTGPHRTEENPAAQGSDR